MDSNGVSGVEKGKYWGAVKGDSVVGIISMVVPHNVDFDEYRIRALACLEVLGDVKSGEVIEHKNGTWFFLQRSNHAGRSKKTPSAPKVFPIDCRLGSPSK